MVLRGLSLNMDVAYTLAYDDSQKDKDDNIFSRAYKRFTIKCRQKV